MKVTIGRLADIITSLNVTTNLVSDNDTVEFDVDDKLQAVETAVGELQDEVMTTVDDNKDMSES